jgi:hypothetical protein
MRLVRRKRCRTCEVVKTIRMFYRHPTCRGGYMHACKVCHQRAVLENREVKREHYNALGRRHDARRAGARRLYLALPHVRERTRQYQRESYRFGKALEARA